MMIDEIKRLKEVVDTCNTVLILAHKSPDGDAVGSAAAWFHFLKNHGKNPTIVFPDRPSSNLLSFLDNTDYLIFDLDALKVATLSAQCDTLFCLDFNSPSRVGSEAQVIIDGFKGQSAMIDHHPNPTNFCDVQISRPEICSTAQLLYHCIEEMGMLRLVNTKVAEGIYLGIMTDTGSFRYPSVDANTHFILGKLIQDGLEHFKIHEAIFDVNTIDKLQLRGFAITEKLVLIPNYPIGYISLTLNELDRFNYQKGDIEGLVNVVLSIEGISVAAIFMESRDGVKISFRSKGKYHVNEFSAKHFGGGGHKYAAGGYSNDALDVTIDRFKTFLVEIIE
jgi:phosphoesterase RecJ-like protein